MSKKLKASLVALLLAFLGLLGYNNDEFGGGADVQTNKIGSLTSFSTSTTATMPVRLLEADASRRYAMISNRSDTAVYLFATSTNLTFAEAQTNISASGLVGIYLGANSNYEIAPDNTLIGYVWASSTAASKAINVNYK